MSSNQPNELTLVDPFAVERERAQREAPKPEGNEAVWDDFARWAEQTAPKKPAAIAEAVKASKPADSARTSSPEKFSASAAQQRGGAPKTNLNDHTLGRNRATSSGRARSLLFWVPIVAIAAWFWFGRG